MKSKANTDVIETHIIGLVFALIELLNKMAIALKTLIYRTSSWLSKLEAIIEEMDEDLDKTLI